MTALQPEPNSNANLTGVRKMLFFVLNCIAAIKQRLCHSLLRSVVYAAM